MPEVRAKDVRPGSVIELPQSKTQVIVMGSRLVEYSKEVEIQPASFHKEQFVVSPVKRFGIDIPIKVVEAKNTLDEINKVIKAKSIYLPYRGYISGADPEIFVIDSSGEVLPAWCFLPAKEKVDKNAATPCFWDGFQAEFAPWAKGCLEEFGDEIREGLVRVLRSARQLNPSAKLTLSNTVKLSDALLKQATDDQIRFRCSSSYNVYHDAGCPPPDPRSYPYRFAGGHIHIGHGCKLPGVVISEVIKGLDAILGVIGVSMSAGIDSPERRTMYGRAGEFRLPPHGIEYRVLSNFWLSHPCIYHLVFELMRLTCRMAITGVYQICWDAKEEQTREVINNNDINGARKILETNKHVILCMINNVWGTGKISDMAVRTIFNGIEAAVKDPLDIEDNWDLGGKRWKRMGKQPGGSCASQVQSALCPAQSVKG